MSMVAGAARTDPCGGGRARQRDRRLGLASLLASLAPALRRPEPNGLRAIFEEGARRLVGADAVRLRDRTEPPDAPPARAPRGLALDVPTPEGGRPAVLEASSPPLRRFDEWDVQMLQLASQLAALVVEVERTRGTGPRAGTDGAAPLIGQTPAMRTLRHKIERVAATDFTVLIEGESGTGKELVARQIHELSNRRHGPFVAINCAALVETLLEAELFGIEDRTATGVRGRRGKFEHADNGTLFLDEVSDLSMTAQAKLLRAIQDLAVERVGGQSLHRVNTRIVAATNRGLNGMVASGLFRSDLFYRLAGVEIRVPPLRERQADVLELADYFLERHRSTRHLQLSPAARDALRAYEWPGNVRELQRIVESVIALAQSEQVELDDLPASVRRDYEEVLLPSLGRDDTMRAWGSRYARLVLQRCDDNKRKACDVLGISYHTLQAYLHYRDRPRRQAAPTVWTDRRATQAATAAES